MMHTIARSMPCKLLHLCAFKAHHAPPDSARLKAITRGICAAGHYLGARLLCTAPYVYLKHVLDCSYLYANARCTPLFACEPHAAMHHAMGGMKGEQCLNYNFVLSWDMRTHESVCNADGLRSEARLQVAPNHFLLASSYHGSRF